LASIRGRPNMEGSERLHTPPARDPRVWRVRRAAIAESAGTTWCPLAVPKLVVGREADQR